MSALPQVQTPGLKPDEFQRCGMFCTAHGEECFAPHREDDPVLKPRGAIEDHYHGGWAIYGNVHCEWVRAL